MAHVALFRKYRSQDFDQLSGQDHVSLTLRNAIRLGRVAQAYLFCGPRGTGKTSSARIFAKALNCIGADPANPLKTPPDQPCNQCRICRGITEGASLDVTEIDAASHTGVDSVREVIIEKAGFAPVESRYKVYVIDEVHKLSNAAFNALLKTLEEPPAHLVFILATTDPHDLPATIVSRCQRFDFRRISQRDIFQRLEYICGQEGYVAAPEALQMVAEAADGALRDALVILEQAAAFADGQLTAANVVTLLGVTERDALFRFADLLLARDVEGALELLDALLAEGKDLVQLARDLLAHVRALLIARVSRDPQGILKVGAEQLQRLQQQASTTDVHELMRQARILIELEQELKDPAHARLSWEVALIRLTAADGSGPSSPAQVVGARPAVPATQAQRAEPRAQQVASPVVQQAAPQHAQPPANAAPARSATPPTTTTPPLPGAAAAPSPTFAGPPPAQSAPPPRKSVDDDKSTPPWEASSTAPPQAATPPPQTIPPPPTAGYAPPAGHPVPANTRVEPVPQRTPPPASTAQAAAGAVTLESFRRAWGELLDALKREQKGALRGVLVEFRPVRVQGDVCVLAIPADYTYHQDKIEAERVNLTQRLTALLKQPIRFQVDTGGSMPAAEPPPTPGLDETAQHVRFVSEASDLFGGKII